MAAAAAWPHANGAAAVAADAVEGETRQQQRESAEPVVRDVPPEELESLLPEVPLFSSPEGLEDGCRGSGFGSGPMGVEGLGLDDFRRLAAGFYGSSAPRFPQDGFVAAILQQKRAVAASCPHAVMQALLLRIEALLLQVYTQPALSRDQHLFAFSQTAMLHGHFMALRQWTQLALGVVGPPPELGWPLDRGERRVRRYYDMLWTDVYDSEDTWAVMEQPGEISDELYHTAFAEVAEVLGALRAEWWPCRGTLIALLRHGWRSGNLSRGIVDIVERDIDVMLGVSSEEDWPSLARTIELQLQAKGWDRCWTKSSVEFDSSLRDTLRRDLLYCIRTSPTYILLDVTSYVRDTPGPYVLVHRVCGEAVQLAQAGGVALFNSSAVVGEGCAVPNDLGPLRGGGGLLRRDAVLPLASCCAGSLRVPCPRRPLETIQAMIHSGLEAGCIALPTARGRDPADPMTQRLAEEGLKAEDVALLRERAARLEARGCSSMHPYFEACEGLDAVLAA